MIHQIVRRICGVRESLHGTHLHDIRVEPHGSEHACKQRHASLYGIDRVKGEFLVLLHVFIVCERDSLHRREDRHQRAVHTSCLAPHKLRDIRVLFLRHDAAASRVRIVDLDETVLVGVPYDDLLAETAQVHHDRGQCGQKFDHIIPVRHGIHTVQCRSVKSKQLCSVFPVQRISRPRQRARPQRTVIHPVIYIVKALSVAPEHLEICSHVMRQRDRLRFLQMRKAGHIRLCMLLHDRQDRAEQSL